MKNILKGIASAFVDLDDKSQSTEDVVPQQEVDIVSPVRRVTRMAPSSGAGVVNESMKAQIMEDVDKATPAVLVSFYETLQQFAEIIQDEQTRYKSALIAFQKANNRGADAILSAMQSRRQALTNVIKLFDNELQNAKAVVLADREKANQIDTEIAELSRKIVELKNNKDQILMEASQKEKTLSDQQAVFVATTEAVHSELNEQETKLTTYLESEETVTTTRSKGNRRGTA